MPNLNELGATYVSIIPSLAGIGRAAAEGGRQMAEGVSTAFEQHTGTKFTEHGQKMGAALSAGMRTASAESIKALEAVEIAQRGVENQTRRVARAEKDLAFYRQYGYGEAEHFEQKLATARQGQTQAVATLTTAEEKHAAAVKEGAQQTEHMGGTLRGAGIAAGVMGGAVVAAGNMVAGAFEGMAHAGEELVRGFVEIGETWEGIERTLTVGTTAMAGDLEGLQDTVRAVGAQTSASLNDIATATAALAQRTGLRGGPLQDLVTDFADVGKMLGKPVDTAAFTASLHALSIPMDQARGWLQQLFNISRQTGVPLNSLVEAVSKNGNAFREFGIAAGPAAALLATFTTHGIDASSSMRGLQAAFREASKEGKDLPSFLKDTVAQLEQFHESGNKIAEQRVLERAFGPKGAIAFKTAIDDGILSVASLGQALDVPTDGIQQMYDKTKTLSDEMATFHNQLDTALGPIGQALNESLGGGLKGISDWVATHGGELVGWAKAVGDAIFNATEFAAEFLELFGMNTDGFRQHLMDMKKGFDEHAESIKTNTEVIEDLNAAIDKTKDNKLVLKDNSEDVLKDLRKLGVQVTKLPSGELKITADSPENQKRVQDYLKRLTGKDVDVKVVPKPKTPDGKEYKDDPHALFPGSDKKIDVTISPHVDTQFIPDWAKKLWHIGTSGIFDAFDDDTPENRDKYGMHGTGPLGLPGVHDPLPTGPNQTPGGKADNDRDAKRNATRDYSKAHGDQMPPGTAQWMDGKGPIPKELEPFYHHRAAGGSVPGSGTGDHIPILAEPGEFILPKKVVGSNRGLIHAMMSGAKHFHEGGEAGGGSWYGSSPSAAKLPTTESISSHFAKYAGGGDVGGDNPLPWLFSGATGITPPEGGWTSKGEHRNEEWQERQTQAARSVERQQDHIDDLTETIDDYNDKLKDITSQLNDPENPLTSEETAKLTKEYQKTLKQLGRNTRDLGEAQDDLKTDQRKQDEAAHTPPGGSGRSDEDGFSKDAGAGLVTGMFQELGFPDIFGKAISQWGIVKLGTDIVNHLFGGKDGQGGLLDSLLPKLLPNLFGGGAGPGESPNGPGASGSHGETFAYPSLQHVAAPAVAVPPGLADAMAQSPLFGGGGQGAPPAAPVPVPGGGQPGGQTPSGQSPSATPDPLNPATRNLAPAVYGGGGGSNPGKAALSSYITQRGQQLGLTPTEIGMAQAVAKHEGLGPTGNPSMGFGPEAKAAGMNFDNNPMGAIDQFYKQYVGRLPANLNRNDPNAVSDYIWHTVHGATDPNYGPSLLGAYPGPVTGDDGGGGGGYGGSSGNAAAGVPPPTVQSAGFTKPGSAPAGFTPQHYGLARGTDIRQGAAGFPQWINQMGAAFGLSPSTYAGHQEGSGQNQGVDWFPSGTTPDMSGASYTPEQTGRMQAFAQYLQGVMPGTDPQGQVIFANRSTGQKFGVAQGQLAGPGTSQPGYYRDDWGGHQGHVHTRFNVSEPVPGGDGGSSGLFRNAGYAGPGGPSMPDFNTPNFNQLAPPSSGSSNNDPQAHQESSPPPPTSTTGGPGAAMEWGLMAAGAMIGSIGQTSADAMHQSQRMNDMTPEGAASSQRENQAMSAAWTRRTDSNWAASAPTPASSVNAAVTRARAQDAQPSVPAGNTTNYINNNSGVMGKSEIDSRLHQSVVNANRGASSAFNPALV